MLADVALAVALADSAHAHVLGAAARRAARVREQAEEAAWKPWRAVEDEWSASTSDRPYHYFGSGKTFYLIGEAFGRAMVELGSEQR